MRRLTPLRWFTIIALVLVVMGVWSSLSRTLDVPAIAKYAPKESGLVVTASSVEELWYAVSDHFFTGGRAANDSAPLQEWVATLDEELRAADIILHGPDDLATYGIDAHRRVLVAVLFARTLNRPEQSLESVTQTVAVVPVNDYPLFVASLARVLDESALSDSVIEVDGTPIPVTTLGPAVHVIHPDDGTAVIGSSVAILRRSAGDRAANLAYFRTNDLLYAGIRRLPRGQALRRSTLFFYAQHPLVPGIGSATGAATFTATAVDVLVDLEITPGVLHILDDLLAKVPRRHTRLPNVPQTIGGILTVSDPHVFQSAAVDRWMLTALSEWPNPATDLLDELRSARDIRQLALVVAGAENGVPETLLRLRGSAGDLETLVARLQLRLANRRDRHILEQARAVAPDEDSTVALLLASGLLTDTADERWAYYRFEDGGIVFDSMAAPSQLFPTWAYERHADGLVVQLLSPPTTENDLRYREALADADSTFVMSDRYRLAALQQDSVLWLAPDADVLVEFVRQLPPSVPSLGDRRLYREARGESGAATKVELFLDIDRLIALGLLDTDEGVQNTARRVLAQLQLHQGLGAAVTRITGNHLRMHARLTRGGGVP